MAADAGVHHEGGRRSDPAPGSGVLVPDSVVSTIAGLPADQADSVARTILRIPAASAQPIPLPVPGDPDGTTYWATEPPDRAAPVVLYRAALPGEDGRFLVVALMNREAFLRYRSVANEPVVQAVAASVAAGRVAALNLPAPSQAAVLHLVKEPTAQGA
jgi:hypothetical protein